MLGAYERADLLLRVNLSAWIPTQLVRLRVVYLSFSWHLCLGATPTTEEPDSDVLSVVESVLEYVLDMAIEVVQKNQLQSAAKVKESEGAQKTEEKAVTDAAQPKEDEVEEFEYKV